MTRASEWGEHPQMNGLAVKVVTDSWPVTGVQALFLALAHLRRWANRTCWRRANRSRERE